MSLNGALLGTREVLAATVEATTGTLIAASAGDGNIIVIEPDLKQDFAPNERPNQGEMGQLASTPGVPSGSLTFKLEVTGNGTAGAIPFWATRLLPSCGFVASGSAMVQQRNTGTLSFAMYQDGVLENLYGAKGNVKLVAEDGKPDYLEFSYKGIYKSSADASILAVTLPAVAAPQNGRVLTLGSFSPIFNKLEIDCGNSLQLRPDKGNVAGNGTGIYACELVNSIVKGTIDPEATLKATRDWRALIDASTEETFSYQIGSATGNSVTITAGKCQCYEDNRGKRNDMLMQNVSMQFNGFPALTFTWG